MCLAQYTFDTLGEIFACIVKGCYYAYEGVRVHRISWFWGSILAWRTAARLARGHGNSPRLNPSTIPSAVRVARAEIVNAGLAAPPVTNTLPSPMNKFGTSCVLHQGLTTEVSGSLPIRQ